MNSHYSYSPALALLVKQKVDVTPRFAKRALTPRSAQDLHEPYVCHEMRGSVSPEPNILYKALVCQNGYSLIPFLPFVRELQFFLLPGSADHGIKISFEIMLYIGVLSDLITHLFSKMGKQ